MSDIETRLFRYFVALAEARHFAHAALRLGIAPPTLTRQIKKLESDVGVKLLERKGNRQVVLTEAGQRFLAGAREVLRRTEEISVIARQAASGELGCLQLGFLTTAFCGGFLQSWIGPFEQAYPGIDITLHHMSPMAQITAIARKELDVGFGRPPNKYPPGVRGFDVCRESMALALPREHPLARHNNISPAMLAHEDFVTTTPERAQGFFDHTEAVGRIGNFVPRVAKRDDDLMTALTYVGLGYGIAVVPEFMERMNFADVVFRTIAADPMLQASIAFIHGSKPSASAKLLIEHMRSHALRNLGSDRSEPGPDHARRNPAPAVEPAKDVPDGAGHDPGHQNGHVIDFVRRKQE
jgi:DNA-binding transcriptional LysR family regulator